MIYADFVRAATDSMVVFLDIATTREILQLYFVLMDDFVDWEMFVVFHMQMLEDLQHRYLTDCLIISTHRVLAYLEIDEDAPDWNIVTKTINDTNFT